MTGPLHRLNSLLLLAVFVASGLMAFAQVPAIPVADIRVSPEVVLEATVLGVPAAEFARLGIVYPESDAESESPLGFAVVLPEDEAHSLIRDPRTKSVHSLKLRGTPGNTLRFRVDTRVLTGETSFAEILPYFEVGMTFEVTPRVFPNRNAALSSASVVQVRRGPAPQGGLAPLVFETKPIRHDIQIPEGKTILLGGFLTASNSSGLPRIPVTRGNPVLGYVGTQSPRKGDEPEIVVLLSPRVIGIVEPMAPPTVSIVPGLKESSKEPESKIEPPVLPISTSNSNSKPEISIPVSVPMPAPAPAVSAPPAPVPRAPVPDPPARATSPASKNTARFFTVQAGAFSSSVNAESLVTELKRKFEGVFVDKAPVGGTPYRVRVGRLSTLAAAKRIQSHLQAQGFDSFVVTPEMP